MSDDVSSTTETVLPNCNCSKSLWAVQNLRSDTETYKTQILIVLCVMSIIIVSLIVCVGILIYWIRRLQKSVDNLDPISKYKKVAPSTYIKKVQSKDTSSVSSSFKHFDTNNTGFSIPTEIPRASLTRDKKVKKSNSVGTLDRNFFTRSNFSFKNPLMENDDFLGGDTENYRNLTQRKLSDPEVTAAMSKLDKILY